MCVNKLILGDNFEILKAMESETVDLIYLDPPFFSNRDYEVVWGDEGEIRSFQDRWAGGIDHYIAWLKERVVEMHRVLKPTGSIFLHCDWHADAYIRVEILDKIFGKNNFRNEIVWYYRRWTAGKTFQRMHDNILFYSKTKDFTFNKTYVEPTKGQQAKHEKGWDRNSVIINGKRQAQLLIYNQEKVDAAIKQGRINLSEYAKVHYLGETQTTSPDVWEINYLNSQSKERIGYPTQKPMALLERIIKCASNEGDLVLDPFMGGGTTIAVADKLNRKWIGIDQSVAAVKVTELRLHQQTDLFTSIYANSYTLQLHKYDYDALRNKDAFEFESWIIGQFGGAPHSKKGGDAGVGGTAADGAPVQVKRSEGVGVNVIKNFSVSAKQFDKTRFDKNVQAGKPVGYIIAFSFGKGAVQEVARLKNQENSIIQLVTVDSIIPVSKKPTIIFEVTELSRDASGVREIEFIAKGESPSGIELYSWDFDYGADKGFKPSVIMDKEGIQRHNFTAGVYNIAVKAVDNDGLESIETIKLKVNGLIETL
jgi:DNA modification methylase